MINGMPFSYNHRWVIFFTTSSWLVVFVHFVGSLLNSQDCYVPGTQSANLSLPKKDV